MPEITDEEPIVVMKLETGDIEVKCEEPQSPPPYSIDLPVRHGENDNDWNLVVQEESANDNARVDPLQRSQALMKAKRGAVPSRRRHQKQHGWKVTNLIQEATSTLPREEDDKDLRLRRENEVDVKLGHDNKSVQNLPGLDMVDK